MPVGACRLFRLVFIPGHAAAACIRLLFAIVGYYGVFGWRCALGARGLVVNVGGWRQGQSGWKQLRRSRPGPEVPRRAQGARQALVDVERWQREGERHRHHGDHEEEEEGRVEQEQPFLTTTDF